MGSSKLIIACLLVTGFAASLSMTMAEALPAGVPRTVDSEGNILFIDPQFTTQAYHDEALRLVIQEANEVARELGLAETLPITETNLRSAFISPFGYAYRRKKIGNITTSNYWYGVEQGNKFSSLCITDIDPHCRNYRQNYQLPIKQIDTNLAVTLASNYLGALQIDVGMLGRDCDVKGEVSGFWNGLRKGERPTGKTFVPIYDVFWMGKGSATRFGDVAMVELFLPTKTLLQLTIRGERYILRRPLAFADLSSLFPGNAKIITNQLPKMQPGSVVPH
jgi:hypothetical protein